MGDLLPGPKIVNSDDVASHLAQVARGEHDHRTRKSESYQPDYIPSLARFGNPKYWKTCTRRFNESTTKTRNRAIDEQACETGTAQR